MKLALYLYCRGSSSPAVQAFALDHLNDVVVNSVGLAGALLGANVQPWLDPAVAMAMAVWVIWAWGCQASGAARGASCHAGGEGVAGMGMSCPPRPDPPSRSARGRRGSTSSTWWAWPRRWSCSRS